TCALPILTHSLVSASNAVHVQVSPQPSAFLSGLAFLALAPTKFQISSHCKRRTRRLRTYLLWYPAQASARSRSRLVTVLRATPVMRDVERMLLPSTKAATTRVCCSLLSRFILTIMLEQCREVKGNLRNMRIILKVTN